MSIRYIYNKVCRRMAIATLFVAVSLMVGIEMQAQQIHKKLNRQQVEQYIRAGKLPGKSTKTTPPKKTNKTQSSTTVESINTTINAQAQQEAPVDAVEMPAIGAVNIDREEISKRKDKLQIQLGGAYKDLETKTKELEGLTRDENQPLSDYLTKKREIESEIAAINLHCTQIQLQIEELGR